MNRIEAGRTPIEEELWLLRGSKEVKSTDGRGAHKGRQCAIKRYAVVVVCFFPLNNARRRKKKERVRDMVSKEVQSLSKGTAIGASRRFSYYSRMFLLSELMEQCMLSSLTVASCQGGLSCDPI